jgi:uncharacterized protein
MATYLVLTRYLDVEAIAGVRPAHLAWIGEQHDAGRIVISGRRADDTGAVVILRADDEADARALLADDPYVVAGLLEFDLIEFTPVR